MKPSLIDKIEQKNILQTITLLITLFGFMFLLGWMLGGKNGVMIATSACLFLIIFNPYHNASLVLRASKARLLDPASNVDLYSILGKISRRAGLTKLPRLYSMPSEMMNAFVVSNDKETSIVLTENLLRRLNYRELAGIIGHEIAHVRNNDLWVMSVSAIAVQMTHMMSTAGQLMIIFALPAIFSGEVQVPLIGLLLLVFAPTICVFLQTALSRTREYEADRVGAELAGDVHGLASALQKLEQYHLGLMKRMFNMKWMYPGPSLLLTHPPTKDRIKQLMDIGDSINKGWPDKFNHGHVW